MPASEGELKQKWWLDRVFAIAGCGLILLSSFVLIRILFGLDGWKTNLPYWDQAAHALDAVFFAKALTQLDVKQFLVQLHYSSLWPPAIPLIQMPYLAVTELSFGAVRSTIPYFSMLALLSIFFFGYRLDRNWGFAIGLTSAALLIVSPAFLDYSVQEMFEIPGIMLTLVVCFLYFRYLDTPSQTRWRHTVLSATLLFFTKFNYAIMVFVPILFSEIISKPEIRKQLLEASRLVLMQIKWRAPFTVFVYVYILLLAYIHFFGLRFEAFGQTITASRGYGNPLYILIFLILIKTILFHRDAFKQYLRTVWFAPEQIRAVVRLFLLPVLLWLSYPPFFTTFFLFLFNASTRQQSFFSMETLTFYPGAFVDYYSPNTVVGALVCLSLVLHGLFWKRLDHKHRFLLGLVAFNGLLVLSHPNYQSRYLMTVAPFIMVAGAAGFYLTIGRLIGSHKQVRYWGGRIIGLTIAIAITISFFPSREHAQARFNYYSHDPSFIEIVRQVCDQASQSETNVVLGFSSYFNPSAIALTCFEHHPEMARYQMPTTMVRSGFHGYQDGGDIIETTRIKQYFVVDYSGMEQGVGRLQESHLLPQAIENLASSPRYPLVHQLHDPHTGLKIDVFRLWTPTQNAVEQDSQKRL